MAPSSRKSTLGEIRNPLVFFGLALLVIEAIMGGVAATSNLSLTLVFAAICVMAGLFLVVVGAVAFITINWPAHLYEEVKADILSGRKTKEFISGFTLVTSDDELAKMPWAITGPLSKWRTAGGISRDGNIPIETVMKVIESRPDLFRKSPIAPGGIPVFGLRRQAHAR